MTKEESQKLSEVDIRSVDKTELVDISDVKINPELSPKERVEDYIRQVKNPYCYLDHGIVVKVSFNENGKTLEECLRTFLSHEIIKNQANNAIVFS